MDRIEFVRRAAACFKDGDDEGFVAHFHPAVKLYREPELTVGPVVSSRAALAAGMDAVRLRAAGGSVSVVDIEAQSDGVVADLVVVGAGGQDEGGWRLALCILFRDDLICEIRAFWQRDLAIQALRALSSL